MPDEILLLGLRLEIWAFIISLIAILFALLKDFILPLIFKPKLHFKYEEKSPYRRENIGLTNAPDIKCTFLRFSVKNNGFKPALNCRCQIQKVERNNELYGDYQGFPLKWASRPESVINQASGERLNIGIGETEFVDIAFSSETDKYIHLQKYHIVAIGIKEFIEPGEYDITLIFSGDNFKPYKLKFHLKKKNLKDPTSIELSLINIYQ